MSESFDFPGSLPSVTVVVPVFNAASYLPACLQSILSQDYPGKLEVSFYNDGSMDSSWQILLEWIPHFLRVTSSCREVVISSADHPSPLRWTHLDAFEQWKESQSELEPGRWNADCSECRDSAAVNDGHPENRGVGYAKNRCIEQSISEFLCFLDSDDSMASCRVSKLVFAALADLQRVHRVGTEPRMVLYGSRFFREPENSTVRYCRWLNEMSESQLWTQRFRECTVIQPTWFMARWVFERVGKYQEIKGYPEDLEFFLRFCLHSGRLSRVNEPLVMYRYGSGISGQKQMHRKKLFVLRLAAIEAAVLFHWPRFTIWGCGRDGKEFYNALCEESREKVVAFADVSERRVLQERFYRNSQTGWVVPIVAFQDACAPCVLCVKPDLTGGEFEANLATKHWTEGVDYYHFS